MNRILLTFLAILTPALVSAQQPDAEEKEAHDKALEEATLRVAERVNVVGSADTLETLPGSAYVLQPEALEREKQGLDDVHRMLRQVPGVVIQEEEGFGLRPNIGLRGSGTERSSKITLMEDGVLIAPAPYAAPSAYYFPVAGRMQSLEVRKGSSQIKFGPRTNGGALNLISTSVPHELRLDADVAGGQNGTFKGHVNVGDSYENFGWLFETYQLRTDGFKELDGGDRTGFYTQDYLGKLRFHTSPTARVFQSLEIKLGAGAQDADETYLGLTDDDFRASPNRRYAASQPDNITWDHQQYQAQHFLVLPSGLDVTTTVYRNDFARNWYKLQSILGSGLGGIFDDPVANARELEIARGATSAPDDLKVRANNRTYYSQGVQSVAGFAIDGAAVTQSIEAGVRYHVDEEDRLQWEDGFQMVDGRMSRTSVGAPGSQTNRVSDARALALFVQDRIELSRWTFLPGLRYETIDLTREDYDRADPDRELGPTRVRETPVSAFIPGLGVTYRVHDDAVLFGGVHKGFGPPGPGADELTRPEKSVNYELGLRAESRTVSGELVFFYSDYGNLLGADTLSSGGEGEGDFFNGGESRATGIEAVLRADLIRGAGSGWRVPALFSYTYTNAEFRNAFESDYEPWGDVEVGDELPYLAPHQLYFSIAGETDRLSFGVNAHYNARMRTVSGQGPIPEGQGTDSFFVANLFGELDLGSGVRAFANLQNLTNDAYIVARRPAGVRPGLPRTFLAGLKLRLGR